MNFTEWREMTTRLSPKAFGEIIGESEANIKAYEEGKKEMGVKTLIKIRKEFRASSDFLLDILYSGEVKAS